MHDSSDELAVEQTLSCRSSSSQDDDVDDSNKKQLTDESSSKRLLALTVLSAACGIVSRLVVLVSSILQLLY